jgi:hypothetical protein
MVVVVEDIGAEVDVDEDVVVERMVVGGRLLVVVVDGGRIELLLDVDEVVTVVEGRVLLLDVDVLVDADGGRVVRVVLVVVATVCGTLVDVVLVPAGGVGHVVGAGAFRAAKRRG